MTDRPTVSVIISFFNEERFIEEAIASVFAQSFDDWELLLVDDGSTDSSSQIARRYAQQHTHKINYLEHDGHRNQGLPASRNLGIKCARGEYIALLDADDVWLPHKLEQQVAILNYHPEVAMVYGSTQYWRSWTGKAEDISRDIVRELGIQVNTIHKPPSLLILSLSGKISSPPPSDLFLRREIVVRLGAFEETFNGIYAMYEDQAFLAKIFLNALVFVADQCWDRYRVHSGSLCAVHTKAGHERSIRLFYLHWLVQYLSKQGRSDATIWKPVRRMLWPYRHPILAGLLRPGARFMRRLKRVDPLL